MNSYAIRALVDIFVEAHNYKRPLGNLGGSIENLAHEIDVDMSADADTIEMAIRHALKGEG